MLIVNEEGQRAKMGDFNATFQQFEPRRIFEQG